MSRKPKHHHRGKETAPTIPVLRERIRRASAEGRFQQALELARALVKQEPSEENKELLRQACLGRARQLEATGHSRDARVVLESAVGLDGSPVFMAEVARQLAVCGELRRALSIAASLADPTLQQQVLGQAADAAVRQGQPGSDLLPEAWRPHLDLVVKAFAQVEAGQDDQARETLQGIGLQSPFLEWKLLLRGLIAYYQNDHGRALENWQRLAADRFPVRLAAPFRYLIDPAFRTAQLPATQSALAQQADRLQGSGLTPMLRSLQPHLANTKGLPAAFRAAETLIEALKREAPDLLARLADCFYWAVIGHGNPEDVSRYRRVFGTPADDPELARLQALALEHRDMVEEAHEQWQQYEKSVARHAAAWPGGQADRLRALVWCHMGHNADGVPDLMGLGDEDFFGGRMRPRQLSPSAEDCYEKSLKLAPDQLETHVAVVNHHLKRKRAAKADKAARRLLKQFPDHVATLEKLADLCMEAQDYAEAVTFFQRALQAQPLDRSLQLKLANAHSYNARARAEAGAFDEARAEYQAALAHATTGKYPVLCKWAACEFKAGEAARAEELLQQALADKASELAVDFSMLIETIRFKLPRPLKTRFDKEVNRLLAEPPTAEAAGALASTMGSLRRAGVTYHGQKTHEKKVASYLEKAKSLPFSEQQLLEVCASLRAIDKVQLGREFIKIGQRLFPRSPVFYLGEAEAILERGPFGGSLFQVQELLAKARQLAEAEPRDRRQEILLEQITQFEDELRQLNPFASLFDRDMDPFGMDDDDDFDDDEFP